ncbi:hypothetical protein ACMXYW_10575 [Neptuniibacter sp. QD48_55]|uniref:hypothetical protein n=1 Tax=Neptuniibacter sp. QD48_55 TaxID=3398212 RepID=UPI0039F5D171
MDLKDFIKQSIVQVTEAIVESNAELKGTGAVVNPGKIQVNSDSSQAYGRESSKLVHDSRVVHKLDFDVAVVAEDEQSAEAGAKISVMSLKIGADGGVNYTNRSESRIKFSVPLIYPEGSDKA